MSNQNPLAPQGSLLEQKAKGKPYLRVAYVIVALHLLFLGGLLIQGCKREEPTDSRSLTAATNESALPPLDSTSLYNTNASALGSNAPAIDAAQHLAGAGTNLQAQVPQVPAVVETPAPSARDYIVVKGDSFYTIGKKFGVTASAISRANPGVDSTRLKVGDKLQIPAPVARTGAASTTAASGGTASVAAESAASDVYTVKAGDTLGKIAKAHSTTVAEVKSLNGLSTDRINVGQKLKMPAAKAAAAPAAIPAAVPSPGVPAGAGTVTNQ